MMMMSARNEILNRLRSAVKNRSEIKTDDPDAERKIHESLALLTPPGINELWEQFKSELESISGEFHRAENAGQAADIISGFISETKIDSLAVSGEKISMQIASLVEAKIKGLKLLPPEGLNFEERKNIYSLINAAVVHPSYAVADIGSLVFLYDNSGTTLPHFLCENTFAIVSPEQIIANQFELFEKTDSEKLKNMVFVAGPSRTADIEKVLVLGAHGPRRLIVILLDEN